MSRDERTDIMAEWLKGEDCGMGDGTAEWSNDKDGRMANVEDYCMGVRIVWEDE